MRRVFVLRRIAAALAIAGVVALVTAVASARAEDEVTAPERSIKAAFLYKFAAYVQWREGAFPKPDSPIRIGVIGEGALSEELARLVAERLVEGRRVTVTPFHYGNDLDDLHILFVGRAESARLGALARAAQTHPTLIVSETAGSLEQGSMINFVVTGGHVRFEISLASVEKSGITLSSRLLAVAQTVVPRNP